VNRRRPAPAASAPPPAAGKIRPPADTRIPADSSMLAAARCIVAAQTFLLDAHRAGAAEGVDPEFLHELRVTARRLRFAFRLLGPLLTPDTERFRRRLATLMSAMETVRDLDVLLAALPEDLTGTETDEATARRLIEFFREQRLPMQQRLARTLRSPDCDRLILECRRLAATPPPSKAGAAVRFGDEPARQGAIRLLRRTGRRALRRVETPLPERTDEELHQVRIVVRRFRYVCDFFGETVGGNSLAKARRAAAELQGLLGAIQDDRTAVERFRAAAAALSTSGRCETDTVFALGALAQSRRRSAAKSRRKLAESAAVFHQAVERLLRRFR